MVKNALDLRQSIKRGRNKKSMVRSWMQYQYGRDGYLLLMPIVYEPSPTAFPRRPTECLLWKLHFRTASRCFHHERVAQSLNGKNTSNSLQARVTLRAIKNGKLSQLCLTQAPVVLAAATSRWFFISAIVSLSPCWKRICTN